MSGDAGDLLSREADRDRAGLAMDCTGRGFQLGNHLIFRSDTRNGLLDDKEANISLEDFKGFMDTNLGAVNLVEDGLYVCRDPVLVPETVEQENG